jgi:hypothetical protein
MPIESAADLAGMFDPADFAEAAQYLPLGGGAPVPCSIIRHQPDPLTDMGQHHVRQAGWTFMLLISEVPQPAKGARLLIGSDTPPWAVMPWHGRREIIDVQLEPNMGYHLVSVR